MQDSEDSRRGAFSPPNVVGESYMAGDRGAAVEGSFYSRYDRAQTQPATTTRDNLLGNEETLHSDEAWAPATQAPRAP